MLPPQAAVAITATVVAFAAWLVRRPKRDPALARRAAAAMELLAVLGQHGATHVPLQVRQVKYAPTLGIFTAAPVKKGDVLFTLPSELMIFGADSYQSVALSLARIAKSSSMLPASDWARAYVAALPDCPQLVRNGSAADSALIEATHGTAWARASADVERNVALLQRLMPENSEELIRWAICMVHTRADSERRLSDGPMLMPFVDLVNHHGHASSIDRSVWGDAAGGEFTSAAGAAPRPATGTARKWKMELVAVRDLKAGDEVTWSYLQGASRLMLLASFGFNSADAPDASIPVRLPETNETRDDDDGCPPPEQLAVDMRLDARGVLDADAMRAAMRCARLRMYNAENASWARHSRHTDAAWGATAAAAPTRVRKQDRWLVRTVLSRCAAATDRAGRVQQLAAAASAELAAAAVAESNAFVQCAAHMEVAREALQRAEEGEATTEAVGSSRTPPPSMQ